MDFRKLSNFILLAGAAVFLYGFLMTVTNQPVKTKPDSGNIFDNLSQSLTNMSRNVNREVKRKQAKKKMLVGGAIVFAGVAIRFSSKTSSP